MIAGGLVLDSVPGLYRNILVFDFKSLYPSLIRTFNIDPLTHVVPARQAPGLPLVRTPSGAAFRADVPGILPDLVARLWEERAQARKQGDAVGAQATKILMNSLFGVLGASACRLFSPAVANAITMAGQHVIRLAAAAVAEAGHRVIYGDTDSLFVDAGEPDPVSAAAKRAESLRETIGAHVAEALRARVRRAELARARVREGLRAVLDARGPRRRDGEQEAVRGAGGRPGRARRSSSWGSRPCGATGARSPGASSRSSSTSCSTTGRSRTSSAGSWPTSGPGGSTTSSRTGRRSGSRSTRTRRPRRPT